MPSTVAHGVLDVAGITIAMAGAIGAACYRRELGRGLVRVGRRWRLLAPPAEAPVGPPIEELGASLTRLRREMRSVPAGTPVARRRGLEAAYDDVLLQACRSLAIPDTMSDLRPGTDREAERLHLEYRLAEAGLSF